MLIHAQLTAGDTDPDIPSDVSVTTSPVVVLFTGNKFWM